MTDPVTELLERVEKARAEATSGEWLVQHKGLSNSADPYIFDRTYGSTLYAERGPSRTENCDFVAIAANEILKLAQLVRIYRKELINIGISHYINMGRSDWGVEKTLEDGEKIARGEMDEEK